MSSPSGSASPAAPSSRKGPKNGKRHKLRNATFIIPSTRERVKRQITLRSPVQFDGASHNGFADTEETSLLQRRYSSNGDFHTAIHNSKVVARRVWRWLNTVNGRGILKCSLAYLLASLGTFLPFLSNFLGKQDGKHLVATIVVYFHPARSAGSMIEAVMYGIIAFMYAAFISISSMAVSVLCETQFDLIELGYVIVLVVFCGGGLGFVGWTKQKLGSPLVSVACSLASLAIITVLTKENAVQTAVFSNDKIDQVLKMLLIAIVISTAVNLIVWPVSARYELRRTIIDTTDALGDMLTTITRSFLSGSEADLNSATFKSASKLYKSLFTKLNKNLKEAKGEHYVLGTEDEYHLEVRLVKCMQSLAQAIGGLRSAAMTQFILLNETVPANGNSTPVGAGRHSIPQVFNGSLTATIRAKQERFRVLTAIAEASEENSEVEESPSGNIGLSTESSGNLSDLGTIRSPSEIFARFISHLGPSMKSLAYTLSQILQDLPFDEGSGFKITVNEHFRTSLIDALDLYRGARSEALIEIYKIKDLGKERPEDVEADLEEVAASCGHFSFSLQDFAEEMQQYLEILEELKDELDQPHRRSWNWLRIWRQSPSSTSKHPNLDAESAMLIAANGDREIPKAIPEPRIKMGSGINSSKQGVDSQSVYLRILRVIRFLQRDDIRFAIKVGAGAAIWAMFSFIPVTRPYYGHWRGEWGLLSYMLVCSMTIGASNTTGYSRLTGTMIGGVIAILVWLVCQRNPFALAFCGWIVCLGCFYLIVAAGHAPFGRFILLTYNITALYAYSLSIKQGDNDDDEGGINPIISEIALHRLVAVMTGVLWGMIITRIVWPVSARTKFKNGLSILWLRMGLIWKRDPLSTLSTNDSSAAYMNLKEEFALQGYVARLETLRSASTSEFELRGPFPKVEYGRIMDSTNRMLDAFHAINVVIQKDLKASEGETEILKFTTEERAQLCARISHLFQVLASSMKLEYPMNDDLPSTSNSRDRLLAKIYQFRKIDAERENGPVAKDDDYALLYAYALVTGQLSQQIFNVKKEIEGLFGVLNEELLQLY